jgi:Sulfotransferase domain
MPMNGVGEQLRCGRFLRKVRDKFREEQPKLLVVGAPRSGFALLISVLNHLLLYNRFRRDPLRQELQSFIPRASTQVCNAIEDYFRSQLDLNDLIISDEFKLLVGGPKWLKKENVNLACVRKYVGIRGRGDFLAVFSLPKYIMEYYNVIHSHYDPALWLKDSYYTDYKKFSPIRNPLDIFNSSVFSINALTGEYINRFVRDPVDVIRERLALYKLTDLNFVEGLVTPLVTYLKSFLEVHRNYNVMRWEDLVTQPEQTIQTIGRQAGLGVSVRAARDIWEEMKYKNQTTYHVHNFRRGIIGDWKLHLVNEHLEILKGQGFDNFLQVFGYESIEYLDQANYTPFQQIVRDHIRNGRVYRAELDADLFTFAFNKSNFRSSKYDFVSFSGENGVEIERSSIKDENLLRGYMKATEKALADVRIELEAIHLRCR